MFKTLINIFQIPELRNKVLFTLVHAGRSIASAITCRCRASIRQVRRAQAQQAQGGDDTAAGRLASYVSLFSGGNLSQSHDLRPGRHAVHLVVDYFPVARRRSCPSLEKLQKEGETGRKKIQEWTRYATVPLCVIQAIFWLSYMHSSCRPLVQTQLQHGTRRCSGSWASSRSRPAASS